MMRYDDNYRNSITEMPELWKHYDTPLKGTIYSWCHQFDVPTEVVIGATDRHRALYPDQPIPSYYVPSVRHGREYTTEFVMRDGVIEPWWKHNLGYPKATRIVCQEVFEDQGDDGHTDYRLVAFRYVLEGVSPWFPDANISIDTSN